MALTVYIHLYVHVQVGLAVGDIKAVQDQAQLESNLLQVCAMCPCFVVQLTDCLGKSKIHCST